MRIIHDTSNIFFRDAKKINLNVFVSKKCFLKKLLKSANMYLQTMSVSKGQLKRMKFVEVRALDRCIVYCCSPR